MSSRDNILNAIKQALATPVPLPFADESFEQQQFFAQPPQGVDLAVLFAEQFVKAQGQFSYAAHLAEAAMQVNQLAQAKAWSKCVIAGNELSQQLTAAGLSLPPYDGSIADCQCAVTAAEYLVARTGSMLLSSMVSGGRVPSVYAPVHVCVAFTSQLVYDIGDALQALKEKYGSDLPSQVSLATGPSRTADIEKTLVTGVHGPYEVYCILIDDGASATL